MSFATLLAPSEVKLSPNIAEPAVMPSGMKQFIPSRIPAPLLAGVLIHHLGAFQVFLS